MNHPQSLALTLSSHFNAENLKEIADYGCCAFSLLYSLGLDGSDINAIMTLDNLRKSGDLGPNCLVQWTKCVKALTGRNLKTVKMLPCKDIQDVKGKAIVKFVRGNTGHWVVVTNGKIIFNSLVDSLCVREGKPTEMRVLEFEGGYEW
jgi:hypothetical protein